jgi:hypothetical protein
MWGRVGKGAVGTLVLAMATGMSLVAPAHADEADRSKVNGKTTYYIIEGEGRVFEPYTELPNELNHGSPSSDVELQMAPAPIHCEGIGAFYDTGAVSGALAYMFSGGAFNDPQKAWVHNPPSDVFPAKKTFGQEPGPSVSAECPADDHGVVKASFGRYVSPQFSFESASSDTTNERLKDDNVVATETVNKFQNLQIGPISVASIFSKLHVDFRPGDEPKVSYQIQFTGIRNASDPAGALTSEGFFMGGKNLTGDDWVKQFNDQMDKNKAALKPLFSYRLQFLKAKFTRDERSSADRGGSVYPYYYELSIGNGTLEPTARENQTGHGFGMRIGTSRIGGNWTYYGADT